MKLTTGVKRLDELLEGGVPAGSAFLLYGPPFVGKELLARLWLVAGLQQGTPSLAVLSGCSAGEMRAHLAQLDPRYPTWEEAGLVHYIDAYSRTLGAEEDLACATYVDGPLNLNGLSAAANEAQARLLRAHPSHRMVFDSVSTLVAHANPQTVFRFLQVFIGKARRAGATSLFLLERGMLAEADVQMFKLLMDGVLEAHSENSKNQLRVQGLGVTEDRGWLDYRFDERSLELTGSFAARRIR